MKNATGPRLVQFKLKLPLTVVPVVIDGLSSEVALQVAHGSHLDGVWEGCITLKPVSGNQDERRFRRRKPGVKCDDEQGPT